MHCVPNAVVTHLVRSPDLIGRTSGPILHEVTGAVMLFQISGLGNGLNLLPTPSADEMDSSVSNFAQRFDEIFLQISKIVTEHDGDIITFTGDTLLVLFSREILATGDESDSDEDGDGAAARAGKDGNDSLTMETRRAVQCALQLMGRYHGKEANKILPDVQEMGVEPVYCAAAVDIGSIFGHHVGASSRWQFIVTGEPVRSVQRIIEQQMRALSKATGMGRMSQAPSSMSVAVVVPDRVWRIVQESFLERQESLSRSSDERLHFIVKTSGTMLDPIYRTAFPHAPNAQLENVLRRYILPSMVARDGTYPQRQWGVLSVVSLRMADFEMASLQRIASALKVYIGKFSGVLQGNLTMLADGTLEGIAVFVSKGTTAEVGSAADPYAKVPANALKAISAALAIKAAMVDIEGSGSLAIGIVTGPTLCSVLDSRFRSVMVCLGETVEQATAISAAPSSSNVLVDHATKDALEANISQHGISLEEETLQVPISGVGLLYSPVVGGRGAGGTGSGSSQALPPIGSGVASAPPASAEAQLDELGATDITSSQGAMMSKIRDQFSYGDILFQHGRYSNFVVAPDDYQVGNDFLYWLMDFWSLEMPKMLISVTGGAVNFFDLPRELPLREGSDEGSGIYDYANSAWQVVTDQKPDQDPNKLPYPKDFPDMVRTGKANTAKYPNMWKGRRVPGDPLWQEMELRRSRLFQLFSRGIARAAVKANAWMIAGGMDSGVMKLIGHGSKDTQRRVPLIGVATYGKVNHWPLMRGKGVTVQINTEVEPKPGLQNLNPNYTHFIMVDRGHPEKANFGDEVRFRFQIEEDLVAMVPAVLIVANGGVTTVDTILASVRQARPIIVLRGTGRFADLICAEWDRHEIVREEKARQYRAQRNAMHNRTMSLNISAMTRSRESRAEGDAAAGDDFDRVAAHEGEKRGGGEKGAVDGGSSDGSDEDRRGGKGQLLGGDAYRTGKPGKTAGARVAPATLPAVKNKNKYDEQQLWSADSGIPTKYANPKLVARRKEAARKRRRGKGNADPMPPQTEDDENVAHQSEFVDIRDFKLAEVISDGDIKIFDLPNQKLEGIEMMIVDSLYKAPSLADRHNIVDDMELTYAWKYTMVYDYNARRQKSMALRLMSLIMLLNIIVTFLAVLQQELLTRAVIVEDDLYFQILRYSIIVIPIITGILLSASNRFNAGSKWLFLRAAAEKTRQEIYRYRVRVGEYARSADPKVDSRSLCMARALDDVNQQLMRSDVSQSALLEPPRKKIRFNVHADDDMYSYLKPEDYFRLRLVREYEYYKSKTPEMERSLRRYQWSIYILAGGAALLGTLGVELWIAFTTAVLSALSTMVEYNRTQSKLVKYNRAVGELANIQIWWRALSAVEKASPLSLAFLVDATELVLESELTSWLQQQREAQAKMKKDQNGGQSGDAPDEEEEMKTKKVTDPAAFAKQRVAEIYNSRNGESPFPIKPANIRKVLK